MRRFVTLFVLFLSTIPFGVSISGCNRGTEPAAFCNGGDSGPTTTQAATITLQPIVYGISLNYGELGQAPEAYGDGLQGRERFGADIHLRVLGHVHRRRTADHRPAMRAGTWNRNTGGGIADYTYCTPTNKSGIAYIAASFNGATATRCPSSCIRW